MASISGFGADYFQRKNQQAQSAPQTQVGGDFLPGVQDFLGSMSGIFPSAQAQAPMTPMRPLSSQEIMSKDIPKIGDPVSAVQKDQLPVKQPVKPADDLPRVANNPQLVTDVQKQTIKSKKAGNALDIGANQGTSMEQAKQSILDDGNSLQIMGAMFQDLGSIGQGKSPQQLNQVANRLQKDEQFREQLEAKDKASREAKQRAAEAMKKQNETLQGKRRIDASRDTRTFNERFRKENSDFEKSYGIVKGAMRDIVDESLPLSQRIESVIFALVKAREPSSAVLSAEYESKQATLDAWVRDQKSKGIPMPRWLAGPMEQYLSGGSTKMNETDLHNLSKQLMNSFSAGEDTYRDKYNQALKEIRVGNESTKGTGYQLSEQSFADNYLDSEEIHDNFMKLQKGFNNGERPPAYFSETADGLASANLSKNASQYFK